MSSIIKKISVKTVCGDMLQMREKLPAKGALPLMRVLGIATGIKSGSTNFGEWVALRGQFSATNVETGEEFRSNVCFVPDTITDMVASQLAADDVKSVNFAVDVVAKKRTDIAVGYEYEVIPLIEAEEADPLKVLMGGLPELPKLPKLPGGKKAADK